MGLIVHTCKNCKQYVADDFYANFGDCRLMGDANKFQFVPRKQTADSTKCYGWDYESYIAGVYVGKDFGCIHWEKNEIQSN